MTPSNPLPDLFFHHLSYLEEQEFRLWARSWLEDHPDDEPNPLWHPIVRDEIARRRGSL